MKKTVLLILIIFVLILGSSLSSDAARGGGGFHDQGHFGVGVVVGPGWGPWWGPYPYVYPYPYPYYPYEYDASPVVIQSEPEYFEPQSQAPQYRYYCTDPGGYYPSVSRCSKGWMKVVPNPAGSGPE